MAVPTEATPTRASVITLDQRIEEGKFECGAREILKVLRPAWKESDINLRQLTEGHLNTMYVASLTSGPEETAIIIRVPSDRNNAIMDRAMERVVVRLLSDLDLSSPLLAEFANGYCLEYLRGETFPRTLAGADVVYRQRKEISWAIARELAHYHSETTKREAIARNIPAEPKEIRLFRALIDHLPTRDDFHDQASRDRYFSELPDREVFRAEVDLLEKMADDLDTEIVFSHGDAVNANSVYDKENDKVTFVDYELAGFNWRPVDLVNYFGGAAAVVPDPSPHYLDESFRKQFIWVYLQELWKTEAREGQPSDDDVNKLFDLCEKFMLLWEIRFVLFPAMLCKGATASHRGSFDYLGLTIGRWRQYKRSREQLFGPMSY